jgi:NADP-dependent 3-hydroxy acid dehydrogenase YdfG
LKSQYGVRVHTFALDVRDRVEVSAQLNALPAEWRAIDVLVNNSGLSQGLDAFHEANLDDWDTMIDTNIKGLLYVSRLVSEWMVARKTGHIINIGSIAGKETYANGNVYCATKHAVDSLNKAMRIDLLPHAIRVTGIHPGAVETEFSAVRFKGDLDRAKKVYEGFEPLVAQDIAEAIWFVLNRPAHVTINDLVIMPTAQANTSNLIKNKII